MKTLHLLASLALVSLTVACGASTGETGGQSQAERANEADAGPSCKAIAFGGASGNGSVGLANPSALYCIGLGYQLDGSDCVLPDGARCEEWAFFRGECGQSHSFCNRHGGTIAHQVVETGSGTASLAVCTVGTKQCDEVTFASTCACEGETKPDAGPTPVVDAGPAPDGGVCQPLPPPGGSANPASVYCAALGNQLDGSDCVFGDGTRCEAWSFYRGACGQAHSFCNLHGGTVKSVTEDAGTWTATYAECTLDGAHCKESAFAETCECK